MAKRNKKKYDVHFNHTLSAKVDYKILRQVSWLRSVGKKQYAVSKLLITDHYSCATAPDYRGVASFMKRSRITGLPYHSRYPANAESEHHKNLKELC